LKKHEKGPSEVIFIEEGKENKEFWNLWGFDNKPPSNTSAMNKEWNNWFLELDAADLENYESPHLHEKSNEYEEE